MELGKVIFIVIYFIFMLIQMGASTFMLVKSITSGKVIALIGAILTFTMFFIIHSFIILRILEDIFGLDWKKPLQLLKTTTR